MSDCPFCDSSNPIVRAGTCYLRRDKFPVSPGHILVVPYRHVESIFDLTEDELADIISLVKSAKSVLDAETAPDGYNIGINVGVAAGQTVPHAHLHIIPRYSGDAPDPRGGVRGVIPSKQRY